MNDKTKEVIIKILLIIGSILLFAIFPGTIIISFIIPNQDLFNLIFNTILVSFFADGVLVCILLPIFGHTLQKPIKAEKVSLPFKNYRELVEFLECSLEEKGYKKQKALLTSKSEEITVYVKPSRLEVLDCFVLIRVSELSDNVLTELNDKVTEVLIEYYGGKPITETVIMISVFCADRITPAFQKLVNDNIRQGLKNRRLPVGISFGGKNIYIAKQKDGFGVMYYKKLRKKFFDIIGIPRNNRKDRKDRGRFSRLPSP